MDITEKNRIEKQLKEKNHQLEQISRTDPLTGIANRRALFDGLTDEISRHQRYQHPLSVILLDIDHFKAVNDTHGHLIGDEVLIQVADVMKKCLRQVDLLGRYGGEEFAVIMPETDIDRAATAAEKLRKAVAAQRFSSKNLKITISGGVAAFHDESPSGLLDVADNLLYQAKNGGRNQICWG